MSNLAIGSKSLTWYLAERERGVSEHLQPTNERNSVRSELLQAALEEFAAKGFEGATVRGIADRINMAHSAIRHHYKTKEKLWLSAVDFLFARLESELAVTREEIERLQSKDLDMIRTLLRRYVHYCARHPEHARIMFQESVTSSARFRTVAERHLKSNHMALLPIADTLKATAGLPMDTPTASLIYMLTGACQNLFALATEPKLTLGYDPLSNQAIEAHADAIVALFCPERMGS